MGGILLIVGIVVLPFASVSIGNLLAIAGGLLLAAGLVVAGVDWSIGNRSRPTFVER